MAGSRKGNTGSRRRSGATRASAGKGGAAERPASEHAREAVSEWGQALRHAAAALRQADRLALKRLLPDRVRLGARVGHAADAVLSKLGPHGGTRNGSTSEGDGAWESDMPIPIQESMEVAVPARTAYALCTRFADYPEFIDRIEAVEEIDEKTVAFEARVRGGRRRIEVEIVDERPNRRIDWEGNGAMAHSGVVSFHELAPSLTHVELSIDLEPQDLLQRLTRAAHLTERAIRADMHRFKAYAELWQEEEDAEPEDAELEEDELEDSDETGDEEEPDEEAEDEEESEPVEAG